MATINGYLPAAQGAAGHQEISKDSQILGEIFLPINQQEKI